MEKKYKYMTEIGQGTYGVVYKAVHKATGRLVAVKKSREQEEDGVPATSIREMTLLRMLSENKHIVRLLGVDFAPSESKPPNPEKPTLCMVFEYMDCTLQGLMDKYRSKKQKMPSKVIKEIMYQLLLGVSFCHRRGVLHRDLKPANLLVNERELLLKLADFGLGRPYSFHQKTYTQEVVTLWYRAPELLLGSPHYSTPVDVWSIGCIFAELAKMHPLFYGKTELEQLLAIFLVLGTPTEDVWHGVTQLKDWVAFPQWKPQDMKLQFPNLDDDGIDLLSGMLLYEPSKRITAKKALSHPYFKDLDKDFVRYHRKSLRARRSNITYSRFA